MTYGQITNWMMMENPEFSWAVHCYYSFDRGKATNAAFGEIALYAAADQLLSHVPNPLENMDYCGPLHRLIAARFFRDWEAYKRGDDKYFRRIADALQLLKEGEHQLSPVEFVILAYVYLRERAGEGSPLPPKGEVKRMAALMWAFSDCELLEKLHEYLWKNQGLTERQFSLITRQQEWHLRIGTAKDWARYLKEAGLSGLRQRQSGGVRR
jgi:hypothetical protein